MSAPMKFSDYNQKIYFGLIKATNNELVLPEPRIGSFELSINVFTYTADGIPIMETKDVGISEVDFETDKEEATLFSVFTTSSKGIFTATDTSELQISGIGTDFGQYLPILSFIPCGQVVQNSDCAPKEEIEDFMDNMRIILFFTENYIKLDEINPIEESLQKNLQPNMIVQVDIKKPQYFICAFDETSVEF